ncbi:MAG: LbtU family siderophore porin [Bacteriovoracaceae bacterium]|nr:LbtU family siderophore porin [Bacteriovoracaceae bacterium]
MQNICKLLVIFLFFLPISTEVIAKKVVTKKDKIKFSGLFKAKIYYDESMANKATTDIKIVEVNLEAKAKISKSLKANLYYIFSGTPTLYAAYLNYKTSLLYPTQIHFGKNYTPYGEYKTHLSSDPITMSLCDTTATFLGATVTPKADFNIYVYLFKSDAQKPHESKINNFGAAVDYKYKTKGLEVKMGGGFVNSFASTDTVSSKLSDPNNLDNLPGGYNAFATVKIADIWLIAEYFSALSAFDVNNLSFKNKGARPSTYHLEVAYEYSMFNIKTIAAASFGQTNEAIATGVVKSAIRAGLQFTLIKNVTLGLQWSSKDSYSVADGGKGQSSKHIKAQVAAIF